MVLFSDKRYWQVKGDYEKYQTKRRAKVRAHFLRLKELEEEARCEIDEYVKDPKQIVRSR